jgi:Rrf2 family protein
MELAKSCDYAIGGLLYLAQRPDPYEPVLLRDIAAKAGAPEPFLSKVFQTLRASHLVRSHRGRKRGYGLARPPEEITLYDIIAATVGPAALRSIAGSQAATGREPFRRVWRQIEDTIIATMKTTTLQTILQQGEGET